MGTARASPNARISNSPCTGGSEMQSLPSGISPTSNLRVFDPMLALFMKRLFRVVSTGEIYEGVRPA
jgi:hypothetical protein